MRTGPCTPVIAEREAKRGAAFGANAPTAEVAVGGGPAPPPAPRNYSPVSLFRPEGVAAADKTIEGSSSQLSGVNKHDAPPFICH